MKKLGASGEETLFEFTAEGAGAVSETGSLYVSVGSSTVAPSESCLAANQVTTGTSLPCTFQKETIGTFTPRIWTFPTFNIDAAGCP